MSSAPEERRLSLGALPEQLGYVQCSFCTTILLVSVPSCSGVLQMNTAAVQCGNCAGVLSVTLPPRPTPSVLELPLQVQEPGVDDPPPRESEDENSGGEDREVEAEAENVVVPAVNKPPVRRQRTPSAYNCFIKEEIRRIKATDPSVSHKEAFSAASKNWAHFPRIQQKEN